MGEGMGGWMGESRDEGGRTNREKKRTRTRKKERSRRRRKRDRSRGTGNSCLRNRQLIVPSRVRRRWQTLDSTMDLEGDLCEVRIYEPKKRSESTLRE